MTLISAGLEGENTAHLTQPKRYCLLIRAMRNPGVARTSCSLVSSKQCLLYVPRYDIGNLIKNEKDLKRSAFFLH